VNRQIGFRDFKCVGKISPSLRVGHVIRHMRSGCKRIVSGIFLWEMSELMTQERIAVRIFKHGGWIDHVTRHVWPLTKVKRSNVKVTRSR